MNNRILLLSAITSLASMLWSCDDGDKAILKYELPEPGRIEIPTPELGEPEPYGNTGRLYRPINVQYSGSSANPKWTTVKTRTMYNMIGFTPDYSMSNYRNNTNKYGSRTDRPQQQATGRFRTQKIGDRWWIIDPDGYIHYHRGLTTIAPIQLTTFPEGYRHKYGGNANNWMVMTARELKELGVNASGGFSTPYTHLIDYNEANSYLPLSISPVMSFLSSATTKGGWTIPDGKTIENECAVVFYDKFEQYVHDIAKETLGSYAGKSYVLGVFSDNEKCFSANRVQILKNYLEIGNNDPSNKAYLAAVKFMTDKGLEGTTAAFNAQPESQRIALNSEFSGVTADRYYRICRDAIKAVDPNMIYLGSRLHGTPKTLEHVIKAAGKYCDIISVNYYGHWTPVTAAQWEQWTDTPVMVTEFWAQALESGLECSTGTGFLVKTHADKAFFMHNFCLGLLESKNLVGWDWFRYQDTYECNHGVFDKNFNIYPEIGQYMRDLNYNAYRLIDYFDNVQ